MEKSKGPILISEMSLNMGEYLGGVEHLWVTPNTTSQPSALGCLTERGCDRVELVQNETAIRLLFFVQRPAGTVECKGVLVPLLLSAFVAPPLGYTPLCLNTSQNRSLCNNTQCFGHYTFLTYYSIFSFCFHPLPKHTHTFSLFLTHSHWDLHTLYFEAQVSKFTTSQGLMGQN